MKGKRIVVSFFFIAAQLFGASNAFSATVDRSEQAEAKRWITAKLLGKVEKASAGSYLTTDGRAGSVQQNERDGGPLRIFNTTYGRGLFVDRARGVTVHLASPAKSFEAIIGLDGSLASCAYTNTTQQFLLRAGDKVLFPATTVKVATEGAPVKVELDGATEFTLENGDDPRKEFCREAVWADARVILQDGTTLWLGDLPLGVSAEAFNTSLPFSFTYDGKSSSELLATWRPQRSVRQLDEQRTEYATTFHDQATGLVVKWIGVEYHDFPVVEWTLYFENTGSADTPILENIQSLDTWFQRRSEGEFLLHHFRGSPAIATDFEPYQTTLTPKIEKHIATSGGRPTDNALCYFNLDESNSGVIMALGWPGQWAADFSRDDDRGVHVRAGQELTHFKLLPGEKVRSPMTVLMFWSGDWLHGQNVWRKWMLTHNLPHPGGHPLTPKLAASSALWYQEMSRADEASQIQFLDRYREEKIKIDYWWMDAGWYVSNGTWPNTGTWEIDPKRFPNGFRPVSDKAHSMGIQTILWFEFERVTQGSWLWEKHPEWLLKSSVEESHGQRLLNLGNPQVVQWIVDYLDKFITQNAIDVYRIDFNISPLPFWRETDAPDRQGITENKYVSGFLEYLDELQKRQPQILIDTCASGGRRDDIETLRRAVPMHRSDYSYEPVGQQNITYGMSFWFPYYGSPNTSRDDYVFRSAWGPQVNLGWDVRRNDLDYDWMRRGISQWRSVAEDYFGDYYPLTPYDSSNYAWMAWQFSRPENGQGLVQAFRRVQSQIDSEQLELHDLDPNARYEIKNIDTQAVQTMSGRELMQTGLTISMPKKQSAMVFTYRRLQ
jgi:alpha-galactosidase